MHNTNNINYTFSRSEIQQENFDTENSTAGEKVKFPPLAGIIVTACQSPKCKGFDEWS